MKHNFRLISVVTVLTVLLTLLTVPSQAAVNRIEEKINELLEVYPEGSYFTSDGEASYSAQCARCALSNIPARGSLPAGSEYTRRYGECWSCRGFANYVFWYIYGTCYYDSANYETSEPVYGDWILLNGGGHTAIYLWEDEDNIYVYDGNGDSMCGVHYNNALTKGRWRISRVYHAGNYDELSGGVAPTIAPVRSRPEAASSTALSYTEGLYLVTCEGTLNLRESHGTSSRALVSIPSGSILRITDVWVDDSAASGEVKYWGKTAFEDKTGWISLYHTAYICAEGEMTLTMAIADPTRDFGHNYEKVGVVPATASCCGFTKYVCSDCGKVIRTGFTLRKSTGSVVNSDSVKVSGRFIFVSPDVTEEELGDLFPEFVSLNSDSILRTGAVISSNIYEAETYVVIVIGDADSDGRLSVSDARSALRMSIGTETVTDSALASADVDSDGQITVNDARAILRSSIGITAAGEIFASAIG